ncbi:N-6 DNA methylase (plasmid) [Aerococcus urinaeequi]|uniref:N-6 DNA methylase n=1 Tax=Aerococcus urinaeequi TaxID=51665 RepID=A0AAE9XP28_9LACT|nr:N-6 DNA methylase [Aerococcus urinaeequi]WCG38770.1 N-6 DNA methylase [Aerococcus urinaeequi]
MKNKATLECYVTGQERLATPEEVVRQEYAKMLVEDYGYSKKDLIFEYPVKKSPSDTRRSVPVDIAVMENGTPKIFVETKKPEVKEGIEQLKNYMDFTPGVKFGVWTNGNNDDEEVGIHYIEKVVQKNTIDYIDIFNIPEKGYYSIDEQLRKKDLKPTNNLKKIFKNMRGFIAANATGTTRDENILNELIAILICKIYDERYKSLNDYMDFIVINNDEKETANRIKDIFNNKIKQKYPQVYQKNESITLSDDIITYVVAQLQKYSITGSSHQIVSNAFESIIGYASKGSQGQFFTPKNVIELMVNIVKPGKYETLLDPASGTAGFLTGAMNYVWNDIESLNMEVSAKEEEKKEYAMTKLFGIEKDNFLAKISKAYMAVLGDGKSGIHIADSLNNQQWDSSIKANIKEDYFDLILTNPPFGKDIKVKQETKEKYEFDDVDLIFIERSLQLLQDGGILGIILPETIFHSPSNNKVREKFFYKNNIKAIVDIPHDTFRPYNNAKCDIIFIQKNRPQQDNILAIKVDNIGHNHLGEDTYEYDLDSNTFDTEVVKEDISKIIRLLQNSDYMMVKNKSEKYYTDDDKQYLSQYDYDKNIKVIDSAKVIKSDLLVARNYFDVEINANHKVSISQLIEEKIITHFDGHGSPKSYLKGLGTIPYIRVKDIVNMELYINPLDLIPEFEANRLQSDEKQIKEKDIVFVRRGSYRIGDVGIVYKKDLDAVLTRELLVLRVDKLNNKYHITPHNLLYLMNSKEVKAQVNNKVMMDTTLPNIGNRWKDLYIPIYSKETMNDLSAKMESLYDSRSVFWNEFSDIYLNENELI